MGPRAFVLLAAVCFGTTGTAQALGPDAMRPATVGAARIVFGGGLLALIAARARPRGRAGQGRPASTRLPAPAVLLAGTCVAAYQLCFFAAVQRAGVAVGTVVAIGSGPAFAGGLAWLVAREAPGRRWALATTLAAAGVALLVAPGGSGAVAPGGVVLAVGAGAGYAAYTVIAKRLLVAGHPPEAVMGGAFGAGGALLLPVFLLTGGPGALTAGGIALVAYLAVVPTALAYGFFARGLRHLSAGETATLTLAEPLTAAVLGAVVLGERMSGTALAGGGLVLVGLLALAGRRPDGRRATAAVVPADGVLVAGAPVGKGVAS